MSIATANTASLADRRIVYPISDAARELIMNVVTVLYRKTFQHHNDNVDACIAELLNYLPEVQLEGDYVQTVVLRPHSYGYEFRFFRKKPHRPLMAAVRHAQDFDNRIHPEILYLQVRYERSLESDSESCN